MDHLKGNEEFVSFRSKCQEIIFYEIGKVFKSDVLCSRLFNLFHGAYLYFEELRNTPFFYYNNNPFFAKILFSAVFITCKVITFFLCINFYYFLFALTYIILV